MRADRLSVLAHGLPLAGTSVPVRRGARPMRALRSTATHYVLVILLAAALGGTAYAVADYVVEMRTQPGSVMGPGYNPPPPHIPIS
jgi:hypothetical protein